MFKGELALFSFQGGYTQENQDDNEKPFEDVPSRELTYP